MLLTRQVPDRQGPDHTRQFAVAMTDEDDLHVMDKHLRDAAGPAGLAVSAFVSEVIEL